MASLRLCPPLWMRKSWRSSNSAAMLTRHSLRASALFAVMALSCASQEQYPKPLVHTPTDHPAAHILLLSVDGLHAFDLANWVATHPRSSLAELSRRGVTYTNAHTPAADPVAGLLAIATGGTPISTGIVTADGYDRELSPVGSRCSNMGTSLNLTSTDTLRPVALDPRSGCKPMLPHDLLRVNTMFEVISEKVGRTAWAGEDAITTDLLGGPSAKGISVPCSDAHDDHARVDTLVHWIDSPEVPVLFGMSFTGIADSQRRDGYKDGLGTPSAGLAMSLQAVDDSIGTILTELKARHLFESTWIAIAAPYAQSPIDRRHRMPVPIHALPQIANGAFPGSVLHVAPGDAPMVWLRDRQTTERIAKAFSDDSVRLGIEDIYFGARLALTLPGAATDSRTPDLILQLRPGISYGAPPERTIMSYGGMLDQDTHVALMVSGAQLTGRTDPTYVPSTQLAPLLLRALGMEKFDLRALHLEHSPALPGIF